MFSERPRTKKWRVFTPAPPVRNCIISGAEGWDSKTLEDIESNYVEIEMEWTNELALPGGDVAASHRAQGSIFFVGNATVILSYAGFTILTDPNLLHRGDHVHLGYGMTAARRTDPALELEALPPIDFVLLSHMHKDHFDREVDRSVL